MEQEQVLGLIRAVSASNLTRFEWEKDGVKLLMEKGNVPSVQIVAGTEETRKEDEKRQSFTEVTSPIVGTYYQAKEEGGEPFVKTGVSVKKGQVVGLVEAMKLMNEVTAPCDGVVEEITVENEQLVEYGQVLMKICPEGE